MVTTAVGLSIASLLGVAAPSATAAPQDGAARGAAPSVSSPPLEASISTGPWGMTFTQPGAPDLREAPGTGSGPDGTLGFRTPAGWFHATAVQASEPQADGSLDLTLATNDPGGRRLDVSLAPDSEGVIRVEMQIIGSTAGVDAVGIGFQAAGARERYLGFGERSNAVDQRGNEVENYVSDGPYQPEERPFFHAFIPPQGYHPRDDATYFPMPWLLSSAGYGVLIENPHLSYFRLGTDDQNEWSLEVEARRMSFLVFAGPDPADVVRRLTLHTGRQPKAAARWFHGPWYQPIADDTVEEAQMLRDADVPASTANTFLHYLPCGDQVGRNEEAQSQAKAFHDLGYAITTYFNPMVCNDYQPVFDQAAAAEVLTKRATGEPYVYRYTSGFGPDREFMVGQFDFTAPAADAFYGDLLDEAVGDGFDGWMEDFGEYTPLDSRSANGMAGDRMHNLYPVYYHRSSWRYAQAQERPVAGYIRSGWTGVHPYAQLVWGGDPTQDWEFDGLESAVYQGLNIGMSGISRWGSAIGGFFALGTRNRTPELLIRWIQLGAVSGIMRTEKNGVSVPSRSRPHITDPEILPHWRRYAKLRTQLFPYIDAADRHYRETGLPIMRHMALMFPDDPRAVERDDQFMFGPDLLAAPVVRPGQTTRELYLPQGRWIDLGQALDYREKKGQFRLVGADPIRGFRTETVDAPLEQLPLLARAGALITMLPPAVDTLADYGETATADIVSLGDRDRRRRILAFPRGVSQRSFEGDGRLRSRERPGRWKLRIIGPRKARYELQASLATLKSELVPCRVSYGGKPLNPERWHYSARTEVLRATLRDRSARNTLLVRACNARSLD